MSATITVLGAGYVGLTTAALFARAGYTVYAVEPNPKRLKVIQSGKSFFFEAGLNPVIAAAIDSGNLIATDSYAESVAKSQVVFSCVGTPDNPDGSSNLTYVYDAAKQSAGYLVNDAIYVQKSTVPVGTGATIEQIFAEKNPTVSYISNPEFLREGTALYDTLYFDRVVAGGDDATAVMAILDLYRTLETHRDAIAKLADITPRPRHGEYIATSLASAELIKVTANAFLALKISFANSIAQLADTVGADVNEVMDAVGADERIGRAFLNAGRGYGGGCFPKDVSGLIMSGREHGVSLEIMRAAQTVNDAMPGYIIEKLQTELGGLSGKHIAVLGLAFKAGTSDVRRSPGISIANTLKSRGSIVSTHDPEAREEAAADLLPDITQYETITKALDGADAVIIATEWPEFITHQLADYLSTMRGTVFVDAIGKFTPKTVRDAGFTYIGVGRS